MCLPRKESRGTGMRIMWPEGAVGGCFSVCFVRGMHIEKMEGGKSVGKDLLIV